MPNYRFSMNNQEDFRPSIIYDDSFDYEEAAANFIDMMLYDVECYMEPYDSDDVLDFWFYPDEFYIEFRYKNSNNVWQTLRIRYNGNFRKIESERRLSEFFSYLDFRSADRAAFAAALVGAVETEYTLHMCAYAQNSSEDHDDFSSWAFYSASDYRPFEVNYSSVTPLIKTSEELQLDSHLSFVIYAEIANGYGSIEIENNAYTIDARDFVLLNQPYYQLGWNLCEKSIDSDFVNRQLGVNSIYIEDSGRFYFEFYVIPTTPYLVLAPDVFYDSSFPLYVPTTDATFSLPVSAKVYSGQTVLEDATSSISLDRTISFAQARAASSGIIVKHVSYGYELIVESPEQGEEATRNWTVSDSISIYVEPRYPKYIAITGTDSNLYYRGRNNVFVAPSGLTLKRLFNDSSEDALTGAVTYKLSSNPNDTDLIPNDTDHPLSPEVQQIWIHQTTTFENESYHICAPYTLQYINDTVSNIVLVSGGTIYYGNELTKNDFALKAVYASGYEETVNPANFTITTPTGRIMSAFSSLSVTYRNKSETFDSTTVNAKFAFANPTIKAVVVPESLVVAYNNKVSQINLTDLTIQVTYNETDYPHYVTLAAAVAQTKFSVVAQKYSSGNYVNIFGSESIDNYNGTNLINITELTNGSLNCQFVFTVQNYFNNLETKTKTIPFVVLAMTEIKGIKISNPYTDYHVGDKFLEVEDDHTQMVVYWEDQGVLNYSILPLKSGYQSIGIYPQMGTEFKNIELNKQIQVKSVLDKNVSAEYSISVSPKNQLLKSKIHNLVAVWEPAITTPDGTSVVPENGKGVLVLYQESETVVQNGIRTLANPAAKKYGYITDILDEDYQAKLVLFEDYLPEIEGSANATITFPSYEEGEAELIDTCTFGCLFGANNSVNRLFLSGNETASNADWHSAELNMVDAEYFGNPVLSVNGNFSYFTSESVMFYGETDNKIIGYDIVSNDKLLVLKDKSDKEKTVYFRTPVLFKALNASGLGETDISGDTGLQEEFSLIKGNNSVAGISPHTIINFNGDTLFVDSDNQVSGLDLQGIIGDNQRYANSRSKLIDYRLKDLDLSNAVIWSNNKYLFLSVPNVGLFVTHFEHKLDDQYEWWFVTSDNPTVFLEVDNKIYYGNNTGAFGILQNGNYKDVTKIFADKDQTSLVSILPAEERVLIEQSLMDKLDVDKEYKFCAIPDLTDYKNNIFFEIAKASATEDAEEIFIDYETDTFVGGTLHENKIYYFNYIEENLENDRSIKVSISSPLATFGKAYKFKEVSVDDEEYNFDHKSYFLFDALTGERITGFETAEFLEVSICERLDEDVEIIDIDKTRSTLLLGRNGVKLNIVTYGTQNPYERNIKAEIKNYEGVEAYYIGAPMLASSLNTLKTIWQITLTNDTDIASSLKVAIASNKVPFYKSKDIAHTARGDLGIDFNEMDFTRTDFDKKVVPRTYTVNKVLGLQKFLCIAFKNEKGKNAVLSEMAITYTLPFPSYGSD